MHRKADAAGDKKAGSDQRWQVAKVDRQLVAVAKVNGVSCIYSDDRGVRAMAASAGIQCKGIDDLPTPPINPQADLAFDAPATDVSPSSELERPSGQSAVAGPVKVTQPEPARREDRPAVPAPPPQDSSAKPRKS